MNGVAHKDGGRSVLLHQYQHKVGAHKLPTSVHCKNLSQILRFVQLVARSHMKLLFPLWRCQRMKRLWFSLCLSRLGQRNEVCEFQESSEISEIVQDTLALSYSTAIFRRLQVYCQKPTQTTDEDSSHRHARPHCQHSTSLLLPQSYGRVSGWGAVGCSTSPALECAD